MYPNQVPCGVGPRILLNTDRETADMKNVCHMGR